MQLLFVSRFFPIELSTNVHGVFQRLRMFLDAIKHIAQINLLFYVPTHVDVSPTSITKLEHSFSKFWNTDIHLFLCKRFDHRKPVLESKVIGLFRQNGFLKTSGTEQLKAFEACLSNRPDKIFVHRLSSMGPLLKTKKVLPNVYLDLDDIEHLAFTRGIQHIPEWYKRLYNYAKLPGLCWSEYRAIQLAHRTFVCSDKDQEYLTNRWRLDGVVKVPNTVRIPEPQPITSELTLLFIGSYLHRPNIVAAEFLIRKIWPIIYRELPEATLIIAGSPPDKIHSFHTGAQGVRFTGFVEDLGDLYRQSRVICAPILSGSGTRVKIIEAASYGKPIVSTHMGAEGIEMQDGEGIFLRDDPKSFAEACIRLLCNYELCEQMGAVARAVVVNKYDQQKIKKMVQEIIKEPF